MGIKVYSIRDLEHFINSDEFYRLKNIPISKLRAISQINNPRASENDKVLFVAFEKERVIGYFGVLPDYIYIGNNIKKIGWGSCFWVDKEYRKQHIAAALFWEVLHEWEENIFIYNMIPQLEPMLQKTGFFHPTKYKTGIRTYLRFNLSEILPPKKNIFKNLKFLLKTSDFTLNIFNSIRLYFYGIYSLDNFKYENINEIDAQTFDFIENKNKEEFSRRNKIEFNWIFNYPWLYQSNIKDINSLRYYFSTNSRRFFHLMIRIIDTNNNIKGFAIINIRNNHLKVPYYYGENEITDDFIKFLYNLMFDMKISYMTIFNESLVKSLQKLSMPFIYKKEIKRPYLFSKSFEEINELNYFQDGDGEEVFV